MNIIFSQKLQHLSIRHGFTTKTYSNSEHISFPKQNHTNNVIIADNLEDLYADAIVTTIPGQTIGVKTADCVPILLFEKNKYIVAAVHAGWRGTANKIVKEVVEKIIGMGGSTHTIIACVGPSIDVCCYDIPEERLAYFDEDFIKQKDKRLFLNLKKANVAQLLSLGIPEINIEVMPWCTSCDNDKFYSYRRRNKTEFQSNISFIQIH